MTTPKKALTVFALFFTAAGAARLHAQTASIHGTAKDEIGNPIKDGEIRLTSDITSAPEARKYPFVFKTDDSGNYKGSGIAPGNYDVVLFRQGKSVDFVSDPKDAKTAVPQVFKVGEDKTEDFDMTRPAFLAALTPERRKEIEDFRAKNTAAMGANKVVAQLNTTLKTVRADLLAAAPPNYGDVTKDVADMKAATDAKPDESILWITYGDTLKAKGDHLKHEDDQQHKLITTDDAAMKFYSDATDAFKKSADLNAASKKPTPADQAVAYNQLGNVYATERKTPDAVAAFENAAKLDPAKAGMYYNNEAAILANNNAPTEAGAAADKAIAADPSRPDPYYIKGQSLIGKSTVVGGKLTPPAGCIEAYEKYLELAPEGKFAPVVKEVLASLGHTVNTKYKAPGKK